MLDSHWSSFISFLQSQTGLVNISGNQQRKQPVTKSSKRMWGGTRRDGWCSSNTFLFCAHWGVGLGRGGKLACFYLAHMVDATQLCFFCTHARCYASHGVRGVGWGGTGMLKFFTLHTCWTQTLDRSWKSLKTFFPYHMVLKHKDCEHSATHPSVPQYVFMWCWRCSLDSPDSQRFLEELETLL